VLTGHVEHVQFSPPFWGIVSGSLPSSVFGAFGEVEVGFETSADAVSAGGVGVFFSGQGVGEGSSALSN